MKYSVLPAVNGSGGVATTDLLVFSHLRWDFVFQRPQHLMSRFARHRRVFYVEEPMFTTTENSYYETHTRDNGVAVIVPYLPQNTEEPQINEELIKIINNLVEDEMISSFTTWYYTPMALPFTRHLTPDVVIYDCMDELANFKNAPSNILMLERELMEIADVVYTGGQTLYEAKKHLHMNIHPFPSSIDSAHFRLARSIAAEPFDQRLIPRPRLGFFGVIDERMDIDLVAGIARLRPEWQIILIGPIVKIDPSILPRVENIHYLGKKDYKELPHYLSGWDLAFLPFARNEATKYISPTKTPEYLAAGRPVVSTSIRDVVRPYAVEKLVYIADEPHDFVAAAEMAMKEAQGSPDWLTRVDNFLATNSWEATFHRMAALELNVHMDIVPDFPLTVPQPELTAAEVRI